MSIWSVKYSLSIYSLYCHLTECLTMCDIPSQYILWLQTHRSLQQNYAYTFLFTANWRLVIFNVAIYSYLHSHGSWIQWIQVKDNQKVRLVAHRQPYRPSWHINSAAAVWDKCLRNHDVLLIWMQVMLFGVAQYSHFAVLIESTPSLTEI